jgi:hypothetical protein
MADGSVSLRVQGGVQIRELSAKLKEAGRGDLTRKMRANIRKEANPVIADLRRAVMSVQVASLPPNDRGGRGRPDRDTGLRRRVASALTTSVTAKGVRIVVSARRVGNYGAALPKYLDASLPKYQIWRHPVFGRGVWVAQRGQPWFFETIMRHATDFRKAVLAALDETARKLTS